MKHCISNIGVLQTGKMLAVLYGVFGVLLSPFILIGSLGEGGRFLGSLFMVFFMLIVYPVMGFIGGLISAFVYNFVAGIIGGIEITLEPVGENFHLEDYRADEPVE